MKVSIVITAYNKEHTLRKAVESAVGQTWGDVEIVIVEDRSTDGTRDIAFQLAEKYQCVTLLLCGKNVGAGLARRRGIKAAKGDYVLLLDADDWIEADFVERLARRVLKEGADMATGGVFVHLIDGSVRSVRYGERTMEGDRKIIESFGQVTLYLNNRLVKKSLYDKVPYCHRRYIEDVQTCLMLMWHANKNCLVDYCGYHYMYNPESLTRTADEFKTHLFKTLCISDIVKFFAENDPKWIEIYPFEDAYKFGLKKIAECNPTEEMVAPYAKEWEELRQFAES